MMKREFRIEGKELLSDRENSTKRKSDHWGGANFKELEDCRLNGNHLVQSRNS